MWAWIVSGGESNASPRQVALSPGFSETFGYTFGWFLFLSTCIRGDTAPLGSRCQMYLRMVFISGQHPKTLRLLAAGVRNPSDEFFSVNISSDTAPLGRCRHGASWRPVSTKGVVVDLGSATTPFETSEEPCASWRSWVLWRIPCASWRTWVSPLLHAPLGGLGGGELQVGHTCASWRTGVAQKTSLSSGLLAVRSGTLGSQEQDAHLVNQEGSR